MKTDQKRLQLIVLNLFSNAIKFTDKKGSIHIVIEQFHKQRSSEQGGMFGEDKFLSI